MILIGVDVGGTFTDLVITDTGNGNSFIHKVPTTPENPAQAVIHGHRHQPGAFRERTAPARGQPHQRD